MALINIFFVYWMRDIAAFKLVKCKNDQTGELPWQVVAHTGKLCSAQRFREFVLHTNPGLVIPMQISRSQGPSYSEWWDFLHKTSGYSHFTQCQELTCAYVRRGRGSLPISCEKGARSRGYKRTLELMCVAMKHFCGYTPKQVKIFASQVETRR